VICFYETIQNFEIDSKILMPDLLLLQKV